jgi:hypothetical protein
MGTDLKTLTVGEIGELWWRLEQEIGGKLGLNPDPVDVDAGMMLARPDVIRKSGIVQGLQDLGYLPERIGTETTTEFLQSEIAAALVEWRFDTRRLRAIYRLTRADDSSADQKRAIPSRELDLTDPLPILMMQTSFEGELQLYRFPVPEESPSLLSRILQFRMKTFNRYEETVGAPFSRASLETFQRLKDIFGYSESDGDVAFLNQLGNASKLSKRFCDRFRDRVFVYRDATVERNHRVAGAYRIEWAKRSKRVRRFRRRKWRYVKVVDTKKSPSLRYIADATNPAALAAINNTEVNTLGLELLQLRLWQHGYYTGAIDADWGEMSREALHEFFQSCEAFEEDEKKIRDIADGGCALNLVYLLQNLLPTSEKTVPHIKQADLNKIADEIFPENADDPAWSGLQDRAEKTLQTDARAFVALPVTTRRRGDMPDHYMDTHRRRRLNFSWSGIKAAIGGWFRRFKEAFGEIVKVVSAVAKKVRRFILEGVRSVTTVFRFALSKIKRAVRVATAAVRRFYYWLSGKPFGSGDPKTGTYIITRWSTDFDTVNFCCKGCSPVLVKHHLDRIGFMNASFRFMTSVALAVFEITVSIATQNWLFVAYSVYKCLVRLRSWNTEQDPYSAYLRAAF